MLNEKQRKVALELSGNVIVSASPGTGKTRTLVARALHKLEEMPSDRELALITYTNAGADEITSRLLGIEQEIFVGTIHRFCLEYVLRPFSWLQSWSRPQIATHDVLQLFIDNNQDIEWGDDPLETLGRIKRNLDGSIDHSVDWTIATPLEQVAQRYFRYLRDSSAIDFNEVLFRSFMLVDRYVFIARSLSSKFYEILIDEFQDTNIFQYEIFRRIHNSGDCTFFMVGDERQRIYEFAGAIKNSFERAMSDFSAIAEHLEVTYRSTPDIVRGFSSLFVDHPALINESRYKAEVFGIVINEIPVKEVNEYLNRKIAEIRERDICKLSDIAVLTTSWWEAFSISGYLRRFYNVVGLGALPHKASKNAIFSLLRSLCRYYVVSSTANLRSIRRNADLLVLEYNSEIEPAILTLRLNKLISNFLDMKKNVSLIEGLAKLKAAMETTLAINATGIDEIILSIRPEEAPNWSFDKYVSTLAGLDGITVNTIHQSKGLEYEVVFLCNINENRIPHQKCLDRKNWIYEPLSPESLENGRTLLYVGMSRAKALLFITHHFIPSVFIKSVTAR